MAVAPDGSPVGLYLRLSGREEAATISAVVPERSEILELGCGAGRVTHELIARGHRVTAVDNSTEMLEHVVGARTVLADIEALRLDERFDVVLLASHFVNVPDPGARIAQLCTCAAHVRSGGVVLIERYPPGWVATASPGRSEREGVSIELRDVSRSGDGVMHATMRYEFDGQRFDQAFSAVDVDDARLALDAGKAGLVVDRFLDDRASWVVLRR